jgi:oligoendopeptidase F
VLLNHNNNLDSAFTIAHELGHSMHSFYSNTNQPSAKSDYSLFVAEVASTCNEAVMQRYLMDHMEDQKGKAFLLNHLLEQFRTTVFRQTMFAEFEKTSHEMAAQGIPLTKESLSEMYFRLNEQYYGETCFMDPEIASEWMRIPHFYRAFYVYVYATGLCAAVSLSDRILREGENAVKDYRKFLSAGCSVPPIEALKLAGIDMSRPEPVRQALEVFRETVKKMHEVTGK